jgi:hypothetical protein
MLDKFCNKFRKNLEFKKILIEDVDNTKAEESIHSMETFPLEAEKNSKEQQLHFLEIVVEYFQRPSIH